MLKNYTVIFTHPSGATATFIYEDGELSSLAKGLDTEQFWVFKQVKAYLLRNEDADIAIASDMMAKIGFAAQIMNPLPDLLAPPVAFAQAGSGEVPVEAFFRQIPALALEEPTALGVDEMHWREQYTTADIPPHKAPPIKVSTSMRGPATVKAAPSSSQVSEMHWQE